jgi:hypothetical protein
MVDEVYLAAIRKLPCCVCGRDAPSQAAHLRAGNPDYDKPPTGMGEKPDDRWCTPLCGPVMYTIGPPLIGCHAEQHSMNEEEFWRKSGKNPFQIAQVLYEKFGSLLVPRKKKRRAGKPKKDRKPRQTIVPKGFGKVKRKIQSAGFPKGKRKMR